MRLITVCEVCSTPKMWSREEEKNLLYCTLIICPICRKGSAISKELKSEIKKQWGMPID